VPAPVAGLQLGDVEPVRRVARDRAGRDLEPQHVAQTLLDLEAAVRLGDVVLGAELKAQAPGSLVALGGGEQHRHVGEVRVRLEDAQHLQAVHHRQCGVHQDEVRLLTRHGVEHRAAVSGGHNLVAEAAA